MSTLSKLVISQPKPYQRVAVVIVAVLLTLVSQWFYNKHHNKLLLEQLLTVKTQLTELHNQHDELQQQFADINHNNASLAQNLNQARQTSAIHLATEQELKQQLNELQTQVMTLKKELLFYQNITQGNGSSKLQVREVFLSETELPDVYQYRIVLTQGKKVSKPMTGNVKISLKTTDSKKQIDIAEHKLNLRHIQVVEGSINLAENSTPKTVTISVIQGKKTRLTKTVDWQLTKP